MRQRIPFALLAVFALAAAGCQESSQTATSTSETGATATPGSTPAATESAATPAASSTTPGSADFTTFDKSIELAVPGGGSARLGYIDVKVGDGSIAGPGQVAMVHYTGWLTDGTKFDSSHDRGQPLQFKIGNTPPDVIEGWDKGVRGMRVGGKRKLVIPPDLGYGARGTPGGPIPPNATLVFEVELVGIQ